MHTDAHGSESELLEKVQERALLRELALRGLSAKAQLINSEEPKVEWKRVLLDQ